MNKIKICVACVMIICMNITNAQTQSSPSQKQWLKDQHDQTDVFAIPLDSSEAEEEAEEKELKHEQKNVNEPQKEISPPKA